MKQRENKWRTSPELWEKLKPIAHEKRHEPTAAEKALWQRLRMHRLYGLSFRRQFCLGQFIVDFYCSKAKLVIEVDGEIHQYQVEEDKVRQEYLESLGLKVLRFQNNSIFSAIEEVMEKIELSLPRNF